MRDSRASTNVITASIRRHGKSKTDQSKESRILIILSFSYQIIIPIRTMRAQTHLATFVDTIVFANLHAYVSEFKIQCATGHYASFADCWSILSHNYLCLRMAFKADANQFLIVLRHMSGYINAPSQTHKCTHAHRLAFRRM